MSLASGSDSPPSLVLTGHGAVRVLTLNRPEQLNALDDPTRLGLVRVMRSFEDDDAAAVLILTGAGAAFSAGGDLDSLQRLH
ncbi:MAG: enoyl-CoA hydratase-related protein, partial [Actinomycetota bacterium]|nr:enoyl-CoA hydratase-related protein [Actinomycetota bacterium]